jgi:hypothetical protein
MSAAERGNNEKTPFLDSDYKDGIFRHLSNDGCARRQDLSLTETSFGQVAANK